MWYWKPPIDSFRGELVLRDPLWIRKFSFHVELLLNGEQIHGCHCSINAIFFLAIIEMNSRLLGTPKATLSVECITCSHDVGHILIGLFFMHKICQILEPWQWTSERIDLGPTSNKLSVMSCYLHYSYKMSPISTYILERKFDEILRKKNHIILLDGFHPI